MHLTGLPGVLWQEFQRWALQNRQSPLMAGVFGARTCKAPLAISETPDIALQLKRLDINEMNSLTIFFQYWRNYDIKTIEKLNNRKQK